MRDDWTTMTGVALTIQLTNKHQPLPPATLPSYPHSPPVYFALPSLCTTLCLAPRQVFYGLLTKWDLR